MEVRKRAGTSFTDGLRKLIIVITLVLELFISKGSSLQRFIVEPENTNAIQGSTIILKCTVSDRRGDVQWTKDKFALGIDRNLQWYPRYSMIGRDTQIGSGRKLGEYNLQIVDVELSDDAIYQCQVGATENVSGIRSKTAKLNILLPPDAPMIDGGPMLELVKGRPTNVSCRALNGKPASDVSWYINDERVRETYTRKITKEDGKRVDTIGIVTLNVTKSDAGKKIKCYVQNEAMTDPYFVSATIDVQFVPEVQMSLNSSEHVREHDFLRFSCSGLANPPTITWKWYKNGEQLLDENRNILDIPRVTRDDHGDVISCEGINDVGSTRRNYRLDVHYGPRFKGVPQHANVDLGDSVSLRCEADGNPTPSIIWTKKGSNHVLGSTPMFKINSVTKNDISVYICMATVSGFSEVSREIYLLQNGPPRIMSEGEQYASKGDTALVECLTYSAPLPQNILWIKNGKPINYASSGRFSASEEDLPFGRKSTLQILNLHEEDFGDFNCSVSNSYGQDIATIKLIEKVVPSLYKGGDKDVVPPLPYIIVVPPLPYVIGGLKDSIMLCYISVVPPLPYIIVVPPLPYIIGGVVGGIAVLFIIVLVCVLYHRYKSTDSNSVLGSYTDTDSSTENKKREKSDSPSTLMDQWRQDYNKDFYRYSADYEDVNYGKETKPPNNNSYGFIEPYQLNIYNQRQPGEDEYLSGNEVLETPDRYDTLHGYSSFRSTPVPDPNSRLPPANINATKLATNV
ncbi:hypothetical protein LOTGIDRAFT_171177 [Lottia gigantea]|uniref:Ig-like domain-containing protein n=1 Tax=Lottia gigantea TaxID=225164 RepID=V4B0K2_LOTGI|nr:hypothetical protein LOTGIDRAFT_171177 [Lottia gigantea]ESP03648.1 hypothetical protein LOTGIDRAFT_171177 [Lottia gigantea]